MCPADGPGSTTSHADPPRPADIPPRTSRGPRRASRLAQPLYCRGWVFTPPAAPTALRQLRSPEIPEPVMSQRMLAALSLAVCTASLLAQQPVTADDYAHAAQFLGPNVDRLVSGPVRPVWIADTSRLWFRNVTVTASGPAVSFVLADAATGSRQPAFDPAKMASALGALLHRTLDPNHLPIENLRFSPDLRTITVTAAHDTFVCDRIAVTCAPDSAPDSRNESLSPRRPPRRLHPQLEPLGP